MKLEKLIISNVLTIIVCFLCLTGASKTSDSELESERLQPYGQSELLKINFSRESTHFPAVIRLIFHASRQAPPSAISPFLKEWNRLIDFGFDCQSFSSSLFEFFYSKNGAVWFDSVAGIFELLRLPVVCFTSVTPPGIDKTLAYFGSSQGNLKRVGTGNFTTENGAAYRAIGLAVPKDPSNLSGPHCVFLRLKDEITWTGFDDELNLWYENYSNSFISSIEASAILYLRIDEANVGHFPGDNIKIEADPEYPLIPAVIRLINGIPYRRSDVYISYRWENTIHCWPRRVLEKIWEKGLRYKFEAREIAYFLKDFNLFGDLKTLFVAAFQIFGCLANLIDSPEELSNVKGKEVVFLAHGSHQLKNAAFLTQNGDKHYRATAFALPKDPSNPSGHQLVYVRAVDDYFWNVFDDEAGLHINLTAPIPVVRSGISHCDVALLSPTIIIYQDTSISSSDGDNSDNNDYSDDSDNSDNSGNSDDIDYQA